MRTAICDSDSSEIKHSQDAVLKKAGVSFDGAPEGLESLSPHYDVDQHARYVVLLARALYEQGCMNVALAGPYGSGKSSILAKFVEVYANRCISISLSTLAPQVPEADKGTDKPKDSGSATENGSSKPLDNQRNEEGLTNDLEREIVRQLLYRGEYKKVPRSRFNQIHPVSKLGSISGAAVMSALTLAVIMLVLYCTDNARDKANNWVQLLLSPATPWKCAICIALALGFIALAVLYRYLIRHGGNRIRLGQVSVGGASLKLEDGSYSYFDQYLDEIIYFFEANEFDTVIFEDLDRFNDPLILERLKELNYLLNGSPGIKRKQHNTRKIHFVYAVRDSLFEASSIEATGERIAAESQDAVVNGAGRVKLFDQVIPVLPFISEFNAYDLASGLFGDIMHTMADDEDRSRFDSCLRTVAPLLSDMRLLKDVHNEYLVLQSELGPASIRGRKLGLKASELLGITVYKSVYPRDFEMMSFGKSWLNDVYRAYTQATTARIAYLQRAADWLDSSDLAQYELDQRTDKLASRLRQVLSTIVPGQPNNVTIGVAGHDYHMPDFNNRRLWESLAHLEDAGKVTIYSYYQSYRVELPKRVFMQLVSGAFDSDDIALFDCIGKPDEAMPFIAEELDSLRGSDFCERLALECKLPIDAAQDEPETFEDYVRRSAPGELAMALILGGFIRKDFQLYASLYPIDGRPAVINFIANHVRLNRMNVEFALEVDDCRELIRRLPETQLLEPRCYNMDLLEYLVKGDWPRAERVARVVVDSACSFFESDGRKLLAGFIKTKPEDSWNNDKVLGEIVRQFDGAFDFVVGKGLIPEECLQDVVRSCFGMLDKVETGMSYTVEKFSPWFHKNWRAIDFKQLQLTETQAVNLRSLLEECNFETPDLNCFSGFLLSELVSCGMYSVTRENLLIATNSSTVPSLDAMESDIDDIADVFARATRDAGSIDAYLSCLEGRECSILSYNQSVLDALVKSTLSSNGGDARALFDRFFDSAADSFAIESVASVLEGVSQASDGSEVADNDKAQIELVASLIRHDDIIPTVANAVAIMSWAKRHGCEPVEVGLTELLSRKDALEVSGGTIAQDNITGLAKLILSCPELDDACTSKLLARLHKKKPFEGAKPLVGAGDWDFPFRGGELLSHLVESAIVDDPVVAYTRLGRDDWRYRERCLLIIQKKYSPDYYRRLPKGIPLTQDVGNIISSNVLGGGWIQDIVTSRASNLLEQGSAQPEQYVEVAIALGKRGQPIEGPIMSRLREGDLSWATAKPLFESVLSTPTKATILAANIDNFDEDQLVDALKSMGGPYSEIASDDNRRVRLPRNKANEKIADASRKLVHISTVKIKSDTDPERIEINKHRPKRL